MQVRKAVKKKLKGIGRKDTYVFFRTTKKQKTEIQRAAKSLNLPVSGYLLGLHYLAVREVNDAG